MKKSVVADMAKGARIGIGLFFSIAVLGIGASFAAATWGALPEANSGSTLSSSAWNDVVDHVNSLAGALKVSSGNVGIGVSGNPTSKLEVNGSIARTACPTGMASAGQYCVDTAQRASATWNVANDTCFSEGKRLCASNEWSSACRRNIFTRTASTWNWTDTSYAVDWGGGSYYYYASTIVGHADCNHTSWHYNNTTQAFPYRCCADRVLGGN